MENPTRRLNPAERPIEQEQETRRLDRDELPPAQSDESRIMAELGVVSADRPCLRCGGQMVQTQLNLPSSWWRLGTHPLLSPVPATFEALICTRCTFVEFYSAEFLMALNAMVLDKQRGTEWRQHRKEQLLDEEQRRRERQESIDRLNRQYEAEQQSKKRGL